MGFPMRPPQQEDDDQHGVRRAVVGRDGGAPRDAIVQVKERSGQERNEEAADNGENHDHQERALDEGKWNRCQRD